MPQRVLISGIGVAGPTLAFWLRRYGFTPTLVERAPALREGGYILDFWGVGYDVAERMGLLASLRAKEYVTETVRFVDASGRRTAQFGGNLLRRALDNRFLNLLRADLGRVVTEALDHDVEMIFGDSIRELHDTGSEMEVVFESGNRRTFDLVVGADGLHSVVRRLTFGAEQQFEKYLGYYFAAFVADGYPKRDPGVYLSYAAPGRQASRYGLRGDRTAFFFVFAEPSLLDIHPHDIAAQKAILYDRFRHDGWECPDMLALLDQTNDLYFDAVSQIRMPAWTSGRVALVGDAAYCPSLLAGRGSSFAMAGAYILAGELASAGGDHERAFPAYEARLKEFSRASQKAAEGFASSFAPRTRVGLFLRDQAMHLMSIPAFGEWMMRRMLVDRLVLPDYHREPVPEQPAAR